MKIFYKLLIWFLFFAFIPSLVLTYINYKNFSKTTLDFEKSDLNTILQEKLEFLTRFFDQSKAEAEMMARSSVVEKAIQEYSMNNSHHDYKKDEVGHSYGKEIREKLFDDVLFFKNTFNYGDVVLLSSVGDVVFSLNNELVEGKNISEGALNQSLLYKIFNRVKTEKRSVLSDYEYFAPSFSEVILVGSPVYLDNEFVGVFVVQILPDRINEIFQEYSPLLGKTGETLVGTVHDDEIVFVIPIRHNLNAAFNLKVGKGSSLALPMQDALKHRSGEGISTDYRDEEVLAVWTYFSPMNWGLVAKMDLAEAYAPIINMRKLIALVCLITLFLTSILAIVISRSFSKPLSKLIVVANEVSKGNLEVKNEVIANDEIGKLGKALNVMINSLKSSTTSVDLLNQEIAEKEKVENEKNEFIYTISHELRTPLGPIIDGVAIVLEESIGNLTQEQKEFLMMAKRNIERMKNLVNDILEYRKMESRKLQYSPTEQDINEILREVKDSYIGTASKRQVEIQLELADNLPKLFLDKARLNQVLSNLINNSFKFTLKGVITLRSYLENGYVYVEIKDNGEGIDARHIPRLFERFYQVEGSGDYTYTGSGLGLAISKQIIQDHGGDIWVKSQKGQGTTFFFKLPIKYDDKCSKLGNGIQKPHKL